jgi:aminopeptidase N
MKPLVLALAAALLASPAALAAPAKAPVAPAPPRRVVLPTDVRPERYEIRIVPDADKLTFRGEARIAIRVLRPTRSIELNAADITFGQVSLSGVRGAPKITLDDHAQTAAFDFGRALAPGRYTLSIAYAGRIYQQPSGLFAIDYDTAQGKRRALYTQFENSDARRFVPCWDEPGIKAVFSISVEAPAGEMTVSNMPEAGAVPLPGGRRLVTFADTPRMSSYLMFLGVGDFERIHRKVGDVDVGVVVRRGAADQAAFDLDAAAELLGYYDDYFGVRFPLPKLDLISAPSRSQSFCAMENWGAILYFDHCFLVDPRLGTEKDRQNAFVDIAHEMAHQWFGDLVTMSWWDDLWLNEGFASWMENKATDHFHPEWKMWLQAQGSTQNAMQLDAAAGTHPIITPIPDVFAASDAFDSITYDKGEAVIRMLEAYVGPDVFRAGVRNYIARHAYGNTVTDDLWRELDKVSPRPVTGIAHDFTLRAGVPLIEAAPAPGGVRLTQSRFAAEASQAAPRTWRTPVLVGRSGAAPAWRGVVSAKAPATAAVAGGGPAVVNFGQTGYFRTTYAPQLWGPLARAFMTLAPADQLGLLNDSDALGRAGRAPFGRFMDLAAEVGPGADPVVLMRLAEQLDALDDDYRGLKGQAAFRRFARSRLDPVLAEVGWDARPGEPANVSILRGAVLGALSDMDDPAVIAEARRRYAAWLADPDSLTGPTRRTVLTIVARHADAAAWDQLHARARTELEPAEKTRLYDDLGSAHDPALARRALELALSGEPAVNDAPGIIARVAVRYPDEAFSFALRRRARVEEMLDPFSRVFFFTRLADGSRDRAMLSRLDAFARTIPPSTRGEVEKAKAAIERRREVIDKRLPQIDRWLARRQAGAPSKGA